MQNIKPQWLPLVEEDLLDGQEVYAVGIRVCESDILYEQDGSKSPWYDDELEANICVYRKERRKIKNTDLIEPSHFSIREDIVFGDEGVWLTEVKFYSPLPTLADLPK